VQSKVKVVMHLLDQPAYPTPLGLFVEMQLLGAASAAAAAAAEAAAVAYMCP
jgi:hypothetical protein